MLSSHIFENIPVFAFRHPVVAPPPTGFHGGPVILDDVHQNLRHTRYFHPADRFDGYEKISEHLEGNYVYGGPVYDHFGHVMSEMIHRLAGSREALSMRELLLISAIDDERYKSFFDLPSFFREILTFFGVAPEKIRIINRDYIVQNLEIHEQGSDLGGGPKPGYLDALEPLSKRLLSGSQCPHFRKLYISRSHLDGGAGFLASVMSNRFWLRRNSPFSTPRP